MRITKNNIEDIFKAKQKGLQVIESQGYEFIENLFCDNSGLGYENEPAYTYNQTIEQVKRLVKEHGQVYAWVTSVGQFQVNVGIFKKTGKKTSTKIDNNTYLTDDKKIILHDTVILEQNSDMISIYNGGYYTKTTKDRINKYLPNRFRIVQKDFEWYLEDNTSGGAIPFTEGMKVHGALNI